MPRTSRAIEADGFYHVLNRGNHRQRIFRKPADYLAFERILAEGLKRYPVDLLAYCLMPNHWHLVVRPRTDDAVGRLLGWVGVTHVRRHHVRYHVDAGGHLYQGRFKSFPIQRDHHFLSVCRYVEANAVRVKLSKRAELWPFCSLSRRAQGRADVPLAAWPVSRPVNWVAIVNEPMPRPAVEEVRASVIRGRPYGSPRWVTKTAAALGLTSTLRPRGRPRKAGRARMGSDK